MELHLSTATMFAYRNRKGTMNVHFKPLVFLIGADPYVGDQLEGVRWAFDSKETGRLCFDEGYSTFDPFDYTPNQVFTQYYLKKTGVPVFNDDCICEISLEAKFTGQGIISYIDEIIINRKFHGVIKPR